MKNTIILSLLAFILIACSQDQDVHEVKKNNDHARQSNEIQPKEPLHQTIEIPPKPDSIDLVNNPTAIPEGYKVETTHLKKPMMIDFNGDGKLDDFRVLKNPNKTGLKYLFEFRIADSDQVYFYENEDKEYDLDGFEVFNKAEKGETFLDIMDLESKIILYEDAPQKERFALKTDAITVGYPESCGTSLFYIYKDKVHRIYLD